MPEIPIVKAKEFLKCLKKLDCEEVGVKGSHHKVINRRNGKTTVIPIHSGKDLYKGLFPKILKQLDIDFDEFAKTLK